MNSAKQKALPVRLHSTGETVWVSRPDQKTASTVENPIVDLRLPAKRK